MKKIIICLLCLFSIFALVSCGGDDAAAKEAERQAQIQLDLATAKVQSQTIEYDGEAHTLEVTGLKEGYVAKPNGTVSYVEGGTYTIKYDIFETEGTVVLKTLSGTLTIQDSDKEEVKDFELQDLTVDYDGEPHTIEPEGLPLGFEAQPVGEASFTKAGEHTVTYNIVRTGTERVLKTVSAKLLIQSEDLKALADTTVTNAVVLYDGQAHTLEVAGLPSGYEAKPVGEASYTEIGSYDITFGLYREGEAEEIKTITGRLTIDDADFASVDSILDKASKNTKQSEEQEYEVTGEPNFFVPGDFDMTKDYTITFYHTMGQNLNKVLDLYLSEFKTLYPNINIEWTQVGGYDDVRNQISTEITTGSQPNMAYCYPDHVALYNVSNSVVTLDELISSTADDGLGGIIGLTQEQIDDFIEAYYNEGRQFGDGLMYSMPFSKSTEVLYYNKTFFTENKLSVPDHWFSLGEDDTTSMEYVCQKIREIDPTSIPLGYDSESNWFITLAEQMGAEYTTNEEGSSHFLFDNRFNRGIFNIFRGWFKEVYFTTQEIYGSYTSGLFVNVDPTKPRSYMSIGSSAGAVHQSPAKVDNEYPFEVGIVPIPQLNPENPKVISQGPSICIFNKEDPQEVVATWLVLKYLITNVEFQAEFSLASGYVPVIKSVMENEIYAEALADADGYEGIAMLSAKVCLEQADYYYTSPAFNGSSKARDEVGKLVVSILALDKNMEEEAARAEIMKLFAKAVEECKFFSNEK